MVAARLTWLDLQSRWSHYTRRGLYKVRAWADFPKPVELYDRGRVKLWHLTDITAFENAHPELKSNAEKVRKVVGYGRAKARSRHQSAP
jgi:hypothetical protein